MGAHPIVGGALVVPSLVSGHALQQDGVPALAQISSPGSRALHQYKSVTFVVQMEGPAFYTYCRLLFTLLSIVYCTVHCYLFSLGYGGFIGLPEARHSRVMVLTLYCTALLPFFSRIWWVLGCP